METTFKTIKQLEAEIKELENITLPILIHNDKGEVSLESSTSLLKNDFIIERYVKKEIAQMIQDIEKDSCGVLMLVGEFEKVDGIKAFSKTILERIQGKDNQSSYVSGINKSLSNGKRIEIQDVCENCGNRKEEHIIQTRHKKRGINKGQILSQSFWCSATITNLNEFTPKIKGDEK